MSSGAPGPTVLPGPLPNQVDGRTAAPARPQPEAFDDHRIRRLPVEAIDEKSARMAVTETDDWQRRLVSHGQLVLEVPFDPRPVKRRDFLIGGLPT
ncbi:hypothetical protein AWC23_21680 [Mycobacterium saskatchewanense]|uniref:Uncharacterized protein n=1 Tax=Mycobacterium saskatchewanense TaxID=220927 RepID=A0AAJ3NMD6_9MYCO|nr:hypothetical protein AWC23_21680 [Mycobacterium saskatchewanense]